MARLEPLPPKMRLAAVSEWIVSEIRDILGPLAADDDYGIDLNSLNPSSALLEIGLDSVLVIEIQRSVQERLDFRFPAMESIEYQSITDLAEYILSRVLTPAAPGDASHAAQGA
jgi:acyl carrier protein